MGWYISLKERQWVDVEVGEVGDYTYNVSNMYVEAMGKSLCDFDGMIANDAIDTLKQGVVNMTNDPNKYKAMNPKNGWGDYEGAVKYLQTLLNECKKNPNSTINVS